MGARCSAAPLGEAGLPSSGATAAAGCPRNPGGGPATHGGEERVLVVDDFFQNRRERLERLRYREVCVFFCWGGELLNLEE